MACFVNACNLHWFLWAIPSLCSFLPWRHTTQHSFPTLMTKLKVESDMPSLAEKKEWHFQSFKFQKFSTSLSSPEIVQSCMAQGFVMRSMQDLKHKAVPQKDEFHTLQGMSCLHNCVSTDFSMCNSLQGVRLKT